MTIVMTIEELQQHLDKACLMAADKAVQEVRKQLEAEKAPQLMTVAEIIAHTGKVRATVQRWIKTQKIPAVDKVGNAPRYYLSQFKNIK